MRPIFTVDEYSCTGCGNCMDGCPAGAIYMVDGKACVDEEGCMGCGVCTQYCPRHAIQEKSVDQADREPGHHTVESLSPESAVADKPLPFRNLLDLFLMHGTQPSISPRTYSAGPRWSGCSRRGRRRRCGR